MWEKEQERMRELHRILKEASEAYYAKDEEIISNFDNYLEDIEIKKGDMDDVFLNVTGRDMKDHE